MAYQSQRVFVMRRIFSAAIAVVLSVGLDACGAVSLGKHAQPKYLLLQERTEVKNQPIIVRRDNKLCPEDTKERQTCPIDFFIDDFRVGSYYVDNTAKYYLQSDKYEFKVKRCREKCATFTLDVDVNDAIKSREFIITVDNEGYPLIVQTNLPK